MTPGLTLEDIEQAMPLSPAAKEVMLDTILAWASCDGAASQLLASIYGLDDAQTIEYAAAISKLPAHAKMAAIIKAAQGPAPALATRLRRYKKRYERYSGFRDRIAHAHCVGMHPAAPDWVIFQVFSEYQGGLLGEGIQLAALVSATVFAGRFTAMMLYLAGQLKSAYSVPSTST